jgi:hypothetical protein
LGTIRPQHNALLEFQSYYQLMRVKDCPSVAEFSWGEIKVGEKVFKDAKLFPGGAREWDWRETGTHHSPGIQPADVKELIQAGAKTVILSTGMWEYLHVQHATLDYLASNEITTHVLKTEEAIKLYNRLRETELVGALIHSTC